MKIVLQPIIIIRLKIKLILYNIEQKSITFILNTKLIHYNVE